MVWNSTSPNGAVSVKQNTTPMQQNTTYTETTLNNDHFWNIGVNEDGHHKWANMVATNDADKSLQTNASLATGMDGNYFTRFKTATEATVTGADNAQPFFVGDPLGQIMQLLGIRACAVFNVAAGVATMVYKQNMASVTRNAAGEFTAVYTNAMPSNSYMVLGAAIYNGSQSSILNFNIRGGVDLVNNKSVSQCQIRISTEANVKTDPLQAWFICFGG